MKVIPIVVLIAVCVQVNFIVLIILSIECAKKIWKFLRIIAQIMSVRNFSSILDPQQKSFIFSFILNYLQRMFRISLAILIPGTGEFMKQCIMVGLEYSENWRGWDETFKILFSPNFPVILKIHLKKLLWVPRWKS